MIWFDIDVFCETDPQTQDFELFCDTDLTSRGIDLFVCEDENYNLDLATQIVNNISTNIYDGPTVIDPSNEQQFLRTNGRVLVDNIIVNPIPGNLINTDDATLSDPNQLITGITAYAKGIKYTGTMPYALGEKF